LFDVLDLPVVEIKGVHGVEKENHQNGQHTQPVEIVETYITGCASTLP